PYARQLAALLPGAAPAVSDVARLLIAIQDKAEEIAAAPDLATAQPFLEEAKALAQQLTEQAVPAAYQAAQSAVTYPLFPTP
ncbi:MAG: hypothetical protein D6796_16430, partial [Caldilineae bacterium]